MIAPNFLAISSQETFIYAFVSIWPMKRQQFKVPLTSPVSTCICEHSITSSPTCQLFNKYHFAFSKKTKSLFIICENKHKTTFIIGNAKTVNNTKTKFYLKTHSLTSLNTCAQKQVFGQLTLTFNDKISSLWSTKRSHAIGAYSKFSQELISR